MVLEYLGAPEVLSLGPYFLTKREVKSLSTGIQEFNLKNSVVDLTSLPDELVQARLSNLAGTVRGGIGSAVVVGRGAVQSHFEANGLAVRRWS